MVGLIFWYEIDVAEEIIQNLASENTISTTVDRGVLFISKDIIFLAPPTFNLLL